MTQKNISVTLLPSKEITAKRYNQRTFIGVYTMNYGKKFLYIILSAVGMLIAIIGIAYKTGYFPGHEGNSAYGLLFAGLVLTIFGLVKLHRTP